MAVDAGRVSPQSLPVFQADVNVSFTFLGCGLNYSLIDFLRKILEQTLNFT